MFCFIALVQAVFFYHKHTKNFLGMKKPNNFQHYQVVPVNSKKEAINFKIREGGVTPLPDYNPVTAKRITEKPSSDILRILHPTRNLSVDSFTGKGRDGNPLILYPSHNDQAQKLYLKMLSDFTFVFGFKEKCFKYNESENNFILGSCKNLEKSTFDIYMETVPEKKVVKEEVYNTKRSKRYDSSEYSDLSYTSGPNAILNNPKQDRNVTKLVFKNGKATESGANPDHLKFGVEEVNIKTILNDSVPVKRKKRHHTDDCSAETDGRVVKREMYFSDESEYDEDCSRLTGENEHICRRRRYLNKKPRAVRTFM